MDRINALWEAAADHVETLSKEHAAELSMVVAKLVTSYLEKELQLTTTGTVSAAETATAAHSASSSSTGLGLPASFMADAVAMRTAPGMLLRAPNVKQHPYMLPVLSKGLGGIGAMTYDAASTAGGIQPAAMFRHSPSGQRVPFAEAAEAAAGGAQDSAVISNSSVSGAAQLQSRVEDVQLQLAKYHSDMVSSSTHSAALQHIQTLWQQALGRPEMQAQVNRLVEVLEGAVLPHNKHTRRRAEESGPSLHLPGLVKAASTNYTSRKIFARKTAGGKRTYQVALLLDVSQSMQGHLQQCSLETLAMLTDALGKVGLDDFLVLTFAAAPVLIKAADTPWDQSAQLALLENVNCATGWFLLGLSSTGTIMYAVSAVLHHQ